MTTAMLVGILGLAVVESLNPSALVVTISLLSRENPAPRVLAYVAGIFTVFFSLGLAALLGGQGVLRFFRKLHDHQFTYQAQLPIGLALLAWAAWSLRKPPVPDQPNLLTRAPEGPIWRLFLVGIGVTSFEALTAFPYFGALAILLDASVPRRDAILALVAFNLFFITPPLLLLWATTTLGRRAPMFLARVRTFLDREGRLIMLWLLAVVGLVLTLDAMVYFA